MSRKPKQPRGWQQKIEDGLYIIFPPMTKKQKSALQAERVEGRRKSDKPWGGDMCSSEVHSRATKRQWATNKEYREKMEALNKMPGRTARAVEASRIARKDHNWVPENLLERHKKIKAVAELRDRYGLNIDTKYLSDKELDDLYYQLKQW